MAEIWFISDTHFGHSNILKFKDKEGNPIRSFNNTFEMDETMVQRWNELVKPADHVWHLGDVTFRYDGYFNNIMSRLNGKLRLVVGNHDKMKNPNLFKWFEKVVYWRGFREHNFTATHQPNRLEGLRDGAFNVHGHIHEKKMSDPHYINVSVEVRDYAPTHLDQILKEIKRVS